MKCTRVLRRVTYGAFKYNLANSRARGKISLRWPQRDRLQHE
jgi:hypothetical protein